MTLSIMALSIMTLSIMTLSIMTLSIMTLCIMTLSTMTLIIKLKCNTQHHNTMLNSTEPSFGVLNVILLS
jgi:hypothetical protein